MENIIKCRVVHHMLVHCWGLSSRDTFCCCCFLYGREANLSDYFIQFLYIPYIMCSGSIPYFSYANHFLFYGSKL